MPSVSPTESPQSQHCHACRIRVERSLSLDARRPGEVKEAAEKLQERVEWSSCHAGLIVVFGKRSWSWGNVAERSYYEPERVHISLGVWGSVSSSVIMRKVKYYKTRSWGIESPVAGLQRLMVAQLEATSSAEDQFQVLRHRVFCVEVYLAEGYQDQNHVNETVKPRTQTGGPSKIRSVSLY